MNRVVKYGALGLGTCFLLLVMGLVLFVYTFDPNDYKAGVVEAVRLRTGRTLVFDGAMELRLFPQIAISLGGAQLGNHRDFGPEPMVSVRSAQVSVQILPLLTGRIELGDLVLEDPVLHLARNEQGVSNWDDLSRRERGDKREPGAEQPLSLDVASVAVTGGSLTWEDRKAGTRVAVSGVTATTGRIRDKDPCPVELRLDFASSAPDAAGSLSVSGITTVDFSDGGHTFSGVRFSARAEGRSVPGTRAEVAGSFRSLDLNFTGELARVDGLELAAYGTSARGDIMVSGFSNPVRAASAAVTLDQTDLRALAAALGLDSPATADPTALTAVGGTMEVEYKPGRIVVKHLEGEVDGTRVAGSGSVVRGDPDPAWSVKLDVGSLDLDRYLPPKQGADAGGEGDGTLLPVEAIRRLDLDFQADAAGLKLGGANFTKVRLVVNAGDGLFKVQPLSAELYGGFMKASGVVDATGGTVRSDLEATVRGVDVAGLSRDVTGKADYAGIADFSTSLNCTGERRAVMLGTLGGRFEFSLRDGVFPGVDLLSMTRSTHSRKGEEGKVEAARTDSTRFGSITGTGTITDGVVRNRDLEVKAPGLRADGNGAVSLVSREIDYMLKAKLVPQAGGQGGKSSDELIGVLVPIHVTGTLDEPYYWVSLREYVKALGGVVVDTVGSVLGGVRDAVKGVGSALTGEPKQEEPAKKGKFLGIF